MIGLAAGIAWIAMMIGYIIGHHLGFKQALDAGHMALETMLLKAISYVPEDTRAQAIEGVRLSLRRINNSREP